MPELLLELFSEEIPARMQRQAAEDLQRLFTERLHESFDKKKEAPPIFKSAKAYVTPRRLTLVVDGLPLEQPPRREERKGPKQDAPQHAIEGFLKGQNLKSLDECELRDTPKGKVWFAMVDIPGQKTIEILPDILRSVMASMPWQKSMNWSEWGLRWIRPLRSVLFLFDGQVPNSTHDNKIEPQGILVNRGNNPVFYVGDDRSFPPPSDLTKILPFTNTTEGHRFMSPGRFTVTNFADYEAKLRKAHVILDREERKKLILDGAKRELAKVGAELKDDPGLLEEVAGLVEWPVSMVGRIDEAFMDIPAEVLITTMRNNQKYFVSTQNGKFSPYFVITANREVKAPQVVIGGNERVLRARLADARFFWDSDRKIKLEARVAELNKITFHAKLGTMKEKTDRMVALATSITNNDDVKLAARLAKADLVSGMVGEFPELQGIMGAYYARHENLPSAVADAIGQHYSPLGPNDKCPTAPVSVAVALADKLDTLVGFFGIEELPTGSKDPYALRRAALGIIRLITENKLRVNLTDLIAKAHAGYGRGLLKPVDFVQSQLTAFFLDRLKVSLKDQGARHDLIAAAFGASGAAFDITAQLARLETLTKALASEDGKALLALYKRAANILKIEEKKDSKTYTPTPNWILFKDEAEKALAQALSTALPAVDSALAAEDYAKAMSAALALRPAMDSFFKDVMVNDKEAVVRENRLSLLAQIRATLGRVADFSLIEGEQ